MNITTFSLTGTYRSQMNETTFVCTLEPVVKNRPIIMLFMVDASHSMRFYINEAKTIQRQSLVQTVAQLGINNHEIIQNDDYLGIFTFSTEVKPLLEKELTPITESTRTEIDQVITTSLKSDGGQTNYGKAFTKLIEILSSLDKDFTSESPHLTGPALVWFLTDGRPWPEIAGNTAEDIFDFSTKLGELGHELWIIGISEDANKEFLEKIALASQLGLSDYNKKVQELPKEFLLDEFVSEKTLWVDLDISSQENLMHGLVNAIEGARTNLGIVAEIEMTFEHASTTELQFEIGVNTIEKEGSLTKIKLQRYDFLKIGQKMSMAFSLVSDAELLQQIKLKSVKLELFRGEEKISEEVIIYDKMLVELVKEDNKFIKGFTEVRESFKSLRDNLKQMGYQLQDAIVTMEALSQDGDSLAVTKQRFEEIKKFLI